MWSSAKLEFPEVYRKERHAARKGYVIKQESIDRVIEAERRGLFAYLFLQNIGESWWEFLFRCFAKYNVHR